MQDTSAHHECWLGTQKIIALYPGQITNFSIVCKGFISASVVGNGNDLSFCKNLFSNPYFLPTLRDRKFLLVRLRMFGEAAEDV